MTLPGAARLDRALAKLEEDVVDSTVLEAAGDLVLFTAKRGTRSRRVRRTGKTSTRGNRAMVRFGSPQVPWTAPSHFGHGTAASPRAQGGWMPANPFLFRARDQREEDVVDLFQQNTRKAIRRLGLG